MTERNAAVRGDFVDALRATSELGRKMMHGADFLTKVRDEEVAIATTEKEEIWRSDKVVLYRYRPSAERKLKQPVLIVFSLVGSYRIIDLQEDRSFVRSLLNSGVSVYVIDWGYPTQPSLPVDGRLINDYLFDAPTAVNRPEGGERPNMLGVCEGGTFSLCYAALHPQTLQNLILVVTPIDFHAADATTQLGHGFINIWTRNITADDVDRLLAAHGNLPGELLGRFSPR